MKKIKWENKKKKVKKEQTGKIKTEDRMRIQKEKVLKELQRQR